VATAWKLRELRRLVNDEQFTPEQRAAMATGVDVSPFKSAAYGTYNRYDGSSVVNPVGQSEIGVNQARAVDYRSSAAARASRTQAQNAEDAARAWAAEQYGQYHRAGADLRKSEQADVDWRRNYVQRFTQDPTVDPGVAVDAAQKKKLTGTPQRFKVKGPDGSTVWATGTMGVDGKPILTPSTLEVPPNADTSKSYEWQSVDAALTERFPHSTPQERIAYIKGSDMDRSRIMRDWSERAYDADTGEGESAPAPTQAVTPAPMRAPTSAVMPPNRGGGKAAKRAQLLRYADEAVRGGADPAKVQQELQRMLQSLEGP
jgi:hypothetical protein